MPEATAPEPFTTASLPGEERFYYAGGSLPGDAPSYIEREADRQLYEGLKEGEFCYVLTSRQMGKSSLMVRTVHRLEREGIRVAVLDPTRTGSNLTPEQWYYGFLSQIGRRFRLRAELDAYWEANFKLGPLERFMAALRDVVLERVEGAVVLFVDEIDALLSLPFSTDEFFAAIRESYNRRTMDPLLERLSFCLLGVASPSDLIRDTRTTPFNIGRRIELNDFTREEAAPLAKGLGPGGEALLARVLFWTGGHPYLTQRHCQTLAHARPSGADLRTADVDRICTALFLSSQARAAETNLTFVRDRLLDPRLDTAGLLHLYGQIHSGRRVVYEATNKLMTLLRLSGIVKVVQGRLAVRNPIYAHVFDRAWQQENLPDAEVRRRREARRRGRLQATLIVAPIAALVVWAGAAMFYARQVGQKNHDLNIAKDEATIETLKANAESRKAKAAAHKNEILASAVGAQAAQLKQINGQLSKKTMQLERSTYSLAITTREAQEQRYTAQAQAQKARVAERIATLAKNNEKRYAAALLYPNRINRAQRAIEEGDIETASRVLKGCIPGPNNPDVRDFSWHYLTNLLRDKTEHRTRPIEGAVLLLAFSSDASKFAVYSKDADRLRIWDAHANKKLVDEYHELIYRMEFIDNGKRLLCACQNHITVWDVSTHQKSAWDNPYPAGMAQKSVPGFYSLAVTPSGAIAAYGMQNGYVALRSTDAGGTPRLVEKTLGSYIGCLTFSNDGRLLAGGTQYQPVNNDTTVAVWDTTTLREIARCRSPLLSEDGHASWAYSLQFTPDNKFLIGGFGLGEICLWDIGKGIKGPLDPMWRLSGHKGPVLATAIGTDGKILASGGQDGLIKIWDIARLSSGEAPLLVNTLRGHMGAIHSLVFLPGGDTLVSAGEDGLMRYWSRKSLEAGLMAQDANVDSISASRDGGRVATCSAAGVVTVRDTRTGQPLLGVDKAGNSIVHSILSSDGRQVAISASGGEAGRSTLDVYSIDAQPQRVQLATGGANFHCLAFSSDGKLLAAGERQPPAPGVTRYRVRVWDVMTRREVGSFFGHYGWVQCLAFAPDGKSLVSGGSRGDLQFYEVPSGKQKRLSFVAHTDWLTCAVISPDGKWLATGSNDQTIKLWRYGELAEKPIVLHGHNGSIATVAFSPDGNTLISSSVDGTIKFWNLRFAGENLVSDELTLTLEPYQRRQLAGTAIDDQHGMVIVAAKTGQILSWGK